MLHKKATLCALLFIALMFVLAFAVDATPRRYKPHRCGTFLSNCQGTVKAAKRTLALKWHRQHYQKRSY